VWWFFLLFPPSQDLFSLHFCRLWVGDLWMRKVNINFSACGNWEILKVGLNSLTGSLRLLRLQAISLISTWNNQIKWGQNYGLLPLVSNKFEPPFFLFITFNTIEYFHFSCISSKSLYHQFLSFYLALVLVTSCKFLVENAKTPQGTSSSRYQCVYIWVAHYIYLIYGSHLNENNKYWSL